MPATTLEVALIALLGLLIGSFLNVVVYRLPKMLEQRWLDECAHLEKRPSRSVDPFNLVFPRSHCLRCGHHIRWYENIPVLSFLGLRGRCASCGSAISLRYPLVELGTAALFGFCGWRWGITSTALAWAGLTAALLTLGLIDWDATLLPDDINLPLLWAGLVAAALRWIETPLIRPCGARLRAICPCGRFTGAFACLPARKAWAMATSSCLQPWEHGLAGRRWCP